MFGSYYLYTNGTTGVLANGGTYPFGTSIAIDAQVVGVNATAGIDRWNRDRHRNFYRCGEYRHGEFRSAECWDGQHRSVGAGRISVGDHSISASYSGDASFNASASTTPLSFTITKAIPVAQLWAPLSAIARGQNVPLQLTVAIGSSAPPPTGTATFYSGTQCWGPPPRPFDD